MLRARLTVLHALTDCVYGAGLSALLVFALSSAVSLREHQLAAQAEARQREAALRHHLAGLEDLPELMTGA